MQLNKSLMIALAAGVALTGTAYAQQAQRAPQPAAKLHFFDLAGVIRTADSVQAKQRGIGLANLSGQRGWDWAKAKVGRGCNPAYTTFIVKPVSGVDVPHIVPTHCKERTLKQGKFVQCDGMANTKAIVWIDEDEKKVVPLLCKHTPAATKS